jgi:hypothetical protein
MAVSNLRPHVIWQDPFGSRFLFRTKLELIFGDFKPEIIAAKLGKALGPTNRSTKKNPAKLPGRMRVS